MARPNQTDVFGFTMPQETTRDPQREGLIRSLTRRIVEFVAGKPATSGPRPLPVSTETGAGDTAYTSFSDRMWQVYYDRRSVYQDLLEMDRNDPVVHTALNVIADCTVCYEDVTVDGFEWTMTLENAAAMKILQDLKTRLDLGQEVWQIVRSFTCFGEEYREIVVDEEGLVQRFKTLPSYQVLPNFDIYGNKQPGWIQRPEGQVPLRKIEFEEWQIVPFSCGAKRGYFGTGLMTPARRSWRRLQKLTDGMAIARMVRAYDMIVHKVPVKPEWDLKKQFEVIKLYRQSITKRKGMGSDGNLYMRDDPLTTSTEIFIPDDGSKRGDVSVLQRQNMQLMNVEDLRYHQDEILCAIRVPRKYLNMVVKGSSLGGDGSTAAEDKQFARSLRQRQASLRAGLLILARRALIFQGYDADELGIGMRMAKINVDDYLHEAKVLFTLSQASQLFSQTLLQGGLPPELVAEKFMQLSDEHKIVLKDFIKEQENDPVVKAMREKAIADAKGGRNGVPQTDTGDTGPKSAEQIAQALATLGMLAQAEMEHLGIPFNGGYAERLDEARMAIAEIACGNGHETYSG